MTDGCGGPNGEPGCTRPYGSYRPSEAYRDYPFLPNTLDLVEIKEQLKLENLLGWNPKSQKAKSQLIVYSFGILVNWDFE